MGNKTVGYTESEHFKCLEDLGQTNVMETMNPLNLAYCGSEDCVPGWKFGPYIRENFVIHLITGGCGVYYVNGKEYHLSRGNMFVIYPGIETVYEADAETPWSYMWIGFSGHKSNALVEEIGFTKEEPVLKLNDISEICAALNRILEAKELTVVNDLRRKAAFLDALALMVEMNTKERRRKNYSDVKYVDKAVEMIIQSYNEKLKIAEIADKVGVNRSYLSNIFKQEMHMSPQAFLINFRLERAAQLLKETEEAIGSISSAVGYSDALSFSKAFRQKYNVTPSEYRKAVPVLARRTERGDYAGNLKL